MTALRSIRLLPGGDSLDRQRYKFGEVFYDRDNNTLRVYDGETVGGFKLATEAFVDANATASFVSSTAPQNVNEGTFWFDSISGKLYIYYNGAWIEPASSGGTGGISVEDARDAVASMLTSGNHTNISFVHDDGNNRINATVTIPTISYTSLSDRPTLFSGAYADLSGKPTLFSGSYSDLTDKPSIPSDISDLTDTTNLLFSGSYNDLTDKPTIPSQYVLPTASTSVLGGVKVDGTTITINGSGVISASGSGTPGGSNTQVQFNNNGSFAGNSNLTFDGTNLTVGGTITATVLTSSGTGTPTYTSASDFIFNTGNNLGAVIVNGDIEVTGTVTVAPTSGTPTNTATPTGWLKVTVGSTIYYMALYQ